MPWTDTLKTLLACSDLADMLSVDKLHASPDRHTSSLAWCGSKQLK